MLHVRIDENIKKQQPVSVRPCQGHRTIRSRFWKTGRSFRSPAGTTWMAWKK